MKRRACILSIGAVLLLGACMPAGTVTSPNSGFAPPTGKGLVVFYRPSAFAGGAIRFNVNHAEGSLGQLTNGTVLQKVVEPGPATFWAQAISQDSITINVSAGQTYYVRGDVRMGIYAGRPQFTQVSEVQALKEIGG